MPLGTAYSQREHPLGARAPPIEDRVMHDFVQQHREIEHRESLNERQRYPDDRVRPEDQRPGRTPPASRIAVLRSADGGRRASDGTPATARGSAFGQLGPQCCGVLAVMMLFHGTYVELYIVIVAARFGIVQLGALLKKITGSAAHVRPVTFRRCDESLSLLLCCHCSWPRRRGPTPRSSSARTRRRPTGLFAAAHSASAFSSSASRPSTRSRLTNRERPRRRSRPGSGNVYVQTPLAVLGFQPYFTTGAGLYREKLGTHQDTGFALNTGGGVKVNAGRPAAAASGLPRLQAGKRSALFASAPRSTQD